MLAGSLIFETPIDTTGVETGAKEIKGEFGGLKNVANETAKAIESAFSGAFSKSVASAQARVNDLQRQFETVSASLRDAIAADDDSAAEKYGKQQMRLYDQIEAAREKLAIAIQEANQKQADAERRTAEKTQAAAEKTQKALAKTAASAKAVKKESSGISKGFGSASKAVKRFGTRLASIVSSALVFTLISSGLREFTSYLGTALKSSKEFSAQLAKLKGALLTAFQPIYTYVLPVVAKLMQYLTSAANAVAYFFSMLAGSSAQSSAQAAEKLYKEANALDTVGGAAKKAKKALAGFDELNVMASQNDTAGSGGNVVAPDFSAFDNFKIPDVAEKLKDKILEGNWYGAGQTIGDTLMDGIAGVDWNSIGTTLGEVGGSAASFALGLALQIDPLTLLEAAANLISGLMQGLSEAIQNMDWSIIGGDIVDLLISSMITSLILTNPFAAMIALIFTPSGEDLQNAAFELAGAIAGALLSAIIGLGQRTGEIGLEIWNTIKSYVDENVDWEGTPEDIINSLWNGIKEAYSDAKDWVHNNIWVPFRDGFKEAFGINGSESGETKNFGGAIINGLKNGISNGKLRIKYAAYTIWTTIKGIFANVGTWFETKFSEAWQKVRDVFSKDKGSEVFSGLKEGIETTFKEIVNKLIDGINLIITKPFNKINTMLNKIRDVGIMDIKPFQGLWSYNPLSVPQIPKLAQGAVLPPNKPFMAIVGDQKHGTNIEAPLSTIQEAVANVMQDYMVSNMAGHEATVAVLRELLEAVLGISIGDDVIANAVNRYNHKMAVVRGG